MGLKSSTWNRAWCPGMCCSRESMRTWGAKQNRADLIPQNDFLVLQLFSVIGAGFPGASEWFDMGMLSLILLNRGCRYCNSLITFTLRCTVSTCEMLPESACM